MAKKPTRNQENDNNSQNNNEKDKNQSGNTDNKNTDDKAQNAEVITIEKPYGLCGRCGWKPDGNKSYKNYCPMCKKTGTLIIHKSKSNSGKTTKQTEISCRGPGGCGADFCGKCGDELDGTHRSKLTPADGQIGDSPTGESETSAVGGTAIMIPDKTFYGLINQICGAADAIFIPANNLAYLLTFKDYYKYREENDDLIPIITPKDVIDSSIEYEWDTQGFYNSIEVTYNGGKLKYKHDTLIAQYGENTFYYEFPNDDYETAKAKAAALLSAHVRDYGTDIKLTCLYNENITVGGWVKIQKSILNTTNKMEQNVTKKVKHAGTIEDMYEMMQDNIYGDKKVYQIYKKDKVETNQTEYELFFVQGYSIRWSKKYTMTMDIHLKYGPDTPNDPINATIGVGGVATGGGSAGDSSGVAGDGSMTEDQINALASKVKYVHMGSGHDPEKGFKNLTKDYKGDCYDITAGLYYAFNFKAGIKARDVAAASNSSRSGTHHCCQIEKNGEWIYPGFYDNCTRDLGVNSQMRAGKIDVTREPPSADGKIPGYCATSKKKWP